MAAKHFFNTSFIQEASYIFMTFLWLLLEPLSRGRLSCSLVFVPSFSFGVHVHSVLVRSVRIVLA